MNERSSVKYNHMEIEKIKKEYEKGKLCRSDLDNDPFNQANIWLNDAIDARIIEPNAMTLATASIDAIPSSRTVLLRKFNKNGFVFFTNYTSHKGKDLSENPHASLTFFWKELERQLNISGKIVKTSLEESTEYFHSRRRESQIAAWCSHQSEIIPSRDFLESEYLRLSEQFQYEKVIPLPPFWGGYRLIPQRFEFWQGRLNRLHDRFQYLIVGEEWQIDRLSP